ncbi:MAG: TonB-dependent receptor, partial [Bacteroidota bacterium]
MKFKAFLLYIFIAAALAGTARAATLSGYVVDDKSGEPLIGASIAIPGAKLGGYTNKSGFFSIKDIPAKKLEVNVQFVGYETLRRTIEFARGEAVRETFRLEQTSVTLDEVTVEAVRDMDRREITVSKINVPVQQIREIRVGGESDLFRSLQFLPGILTSSQLSSGLFVRGGSPDQNLVLVDGTVVYNPTHLFGFISTFNSEAIADVELIKGGFPAEYGGRLSAVLNITQKEGNKNEIEGMAKIGAISSSASLEGPLGNGSWLVSGRRTYFELIKGLIPEDPDEPIPDFNFYDINAKITQNLSKNDKIFLSGFASSDNLAYGSFGLEANLRVANRLLAARWNHVFGDDVFTVVSLSGSRYDNEFIGDLSGYEFLINNSISDISAKASLEWFTSDILTHKFGIESTKFTFDYLQNFTGDTDSTQSGASGATTNLTIGDRNHSAYMQINYDPIELTTVQAGFRASYFELADFFTIDPRLAVKYRFTDALAVKAAFGIFHQNLRLASSA